MDFFRKIFYRLIFLGLALALAGPFFIKTDGKPLMSLSDFVPSFGKGEITSATSGDNGPVSSFGEQTFYKWKDQNGVWQFSAEPPPAGASVETVSVNTNANIIQSMSKKEINSTLGFDSSTFSKSGESKTGGLADNIPDLSKLPFPLPTTIPGADIEGLINEAKSLQQMSDDRMKMIEDLDG